MRSEELFDIIKQRPFIPYRFTFTGGETYDLIHLDMLVLGRSLVMFARPSEADVMAAESIFYVSLLHIIKVERIAQSLTRSTSNKNRE